MRSYRQYCAVARALDVIGDRWSLLIVRELLLRGPSRYTDLREGLPGIATNLLADRLRDLERSGIVRREDAPPPVATALFSLTDWGEALKPVLMELGTWGAPLMTEPVGDDSFRSHWLSLPVELFLADQAPDEPPVSIEVRPGDEEPAVIEVGGGDGVIARRGSADEPEAVLSGPPRAIIGLLGGELDVDQARAEGLEVEGDSGVLRRVLR